MPRICALLLFFCRLLVEKANIEKQKEQMKARVSGALAFNAVTLSWLTIFRNILTRRAWKEVGTLLILVCISQ